MGQLLWAMRVIPGSQTAQRGFPSFNSHRGNPGSPLTTCIHPRRPAVKARSELTGRPLNLCAPGLVAQAVWYGRVTGLQLLR